MSDLTDRIAQVIWDALTAQAESDQRFPPWVNQENEVIDGNVDMQAVAAAIVAELGLPPTWGKPSFDNGDLTDSGNAK